MFRRIQRTLVRFLRWIWSFWDVLFPFDDCPLGWSPGPLAPVFYGHRDYGTAHGAPGNCRVFYPSIDGSPQDAAILESCGRYPLILFSHGHCNEAEHYKKWFVLPALLARAGYVVVVPEIPNIGTHPSGNEVGLDRIERVIAWMRSGWEFRRMLMGAPHTGVLGHSFGALLTARYAANAYTSVAVPFAPTFGAGTTPIRYQVRAYASIDGVHGDWSGSPFPVQTFSLPKLFCYGTESADANIDVLWSGINGPKHKAKFKGATHWDFLPSNTTTCERGRGPCGITYGLAADLLVMFFAKYLPPEKWWDLPSRIDDSLVPPHLALTPNQEFYAGSYLQYFHELSQINFGSSDCEVELVWQTPYAAGTATFSGDL